MRLLLLNNNPAVSRLIKLSVDKVGYELDEFDDYGLIPLKNYDVIMVDNESFNETELATVCEHSDCNYVLYIGQRGSKKPELANTALEKPFLPTDFLALLEKIKNVLKSLTPQEPIKEFDVAEDSADDIHEEIVAKNSFELDEIEAFEMDEELLENNVNEKSLEDDSDETLQDELSLPSLEEEEEEVLEMTTFDLDGNEDEELDFHLNEGTQSHEQFLENKDESSMETSEEDQKEDLSIPSILDKDEINEVKQLLDDNDDTLSFEDEEIDIKDEEQDLLGEEESVDELVEEKNNEDGHESLGESEELQDSSWDDSLDEALEEEAAAEEVVMPIREDTLEIDEIQEEESSFEISEDKLTLDPLDEESVPKEKASVALKNDYSSLDDLSEAALKRAFGEDVEDEHEEIQQTSHKVEEEGILAENKDAEVIRGEIESTIARSLSGLAQSDILREALRGMRINISITFDEKKEL